MSTKLNALTVSTYAYLYCLLENIKKLERGDSDSAGSTLRTMGIVILVLLVVLAIGTAVAAAAGVIVVDINSANFTWTVPAG